MVFQKTQWEEKTWQDKTVTAGQCGSLKKWPAETVIGRNCFRKRREYFEKQKQNTECASASLHWPASRSVRQFEFENERCR